MLALVLALKIALQVGTVHQIVQGVSSGVDTMAVSRDGFVATLHDDGSLRIWRLDTRTLVKLIPAANVPSHVGVFALEWDERTHELLFPAGTGGLSALDIEGRARPITGDADTVRSVDGGYLIHKPGGWELLDSAGKSQTKLKARFADVVVSGDGKVALGVTSDGVRTVSLPAGTTGDLVPLKPAPYGADGNRFHSLALSQTGDTAAVCLGAWDAKKQLAIINNLATKSTVRLVPLDDAGCDVAIASDYQVAVVALVTKLVGIDLKTGKVRWERPLEFAVTTNSIQLAVRDRIALATIPDGRIRLFDVVGGEAVGDLGHMLAVPSDFWFAPGDVLLSAPRNLYRSYFARKDTLDAWSLVDGQRTRVQGYEDRYHIDPDGTLRVVRNARNNAGVTCFTFSVGTLSDGAPLGTTEHDVWPPKPGKSVETCLDASDRFKHIDPVSGIVVVGEEPKVRVFRVGKKAVSLDKPQGIDHAPLDIGPDGRFLTAHRAIGAWGTLWVWETSTGKQRDYTADPADKPFNPFEAISTRRGYSAHGFSPDGTKLAVGGGDSVSVYTLATGKTVRTVRVGTGLRVTAVALAADGTLAIGTAQGTLAIARGTAALVTTPSDGGAINVIKIRPDGVRIASRSDDGALRIWNGRTGALATSFVSFADGEQLAVTPGGAYAGKPEAAERISWVFDAPTEGFSFERYASAFARPELVKKRLAGDKDDLTTAIVRPPRITLAAPPPARATTAKVTVRAHVEASTGKVTEVRIYVDGRPRGTQTVDAAAKDIDIEVALDTGIQIVTLVAFDSDGRASNPTRFEMDASGLAAPKPELWIVAVGVGWYPQLDAKFQLAAPVMDARAIVDAFKGHVGPKKQYAKSHVVLLEDEQATPSSVESALRALSGMKPNDVAIVFLAGHGIKPPNKDMVFLTSAATPDMSTWAASSIDWTALGTALGTARGRVIVLLDSCHSGHVTTELLVPNTQLADSLTQSQRAGVFVFAASRGDQESWESDAARGLELDDEKHAQVGRKPRPKKSAKPSAATRPASPTVVVNTTSATAPRDRSGEGFFTGAVVAALASTSTDTNRNGLIELSELVFQVQARVGRATRGRQTPWVVRREQFGDYGLVPAKR